MDLVSDVALPGSIEPAARKGPDLSGAINPLTAILFGGVLAAMVLYVAYSIYHDIGESGTKVTSSFSPSLRCAADRAWLRVRQWLS